TPRARLGKCIDVGNPAHLIPVRLPRAHMFAHRLPRRARQDGRMTPIGALLRGLTAGAAGTAAMDALWFWRYKRGGGEGGFLGWEFSSGLCSWDEAPAPALVGKRLFEGLFQREVPPERAALVNNLTHWGYGKLAGAQYGLVVASLKTPRVIYGPP